MDLDLSDDERMLAAAARDFVSRAGGRERLLELREGELGFDPAWQQTMAAAGWLGLLVPAELGGAGASALQAAVVFQELGRGPLPGPWLASSVVATQLLGCAASSPARDEALAGIAGGSVTVVPTIHEAALASATGSVRTFVVDGPGATSFLVDRGGEDGVELLLVDAGDAVRRRRLRGFNGRVEEIDLGDLGGSGVVSLGVVDAQVAERALDVARLVVAAYRVGGCERALEMSILHSSTRVQFGQPIGRFQRVQDHIVRIVNALDAARWATYEGLWRVDTGRTAVASAAMAAIVSAEGYVEATNAAHEVHAGVGSDPAFGLALYTEAARALYHYLGSPRRLRKRLGRELLEVAS